MKMPSCAHVKIVVVGAGGTGGWAIPHIYRLCHVCDRQIKVILCDGDIVEEKNLIRQNFVVQDIGQNKAKVLAERYAGAFAMEPQYIPDYIEDEDQLRKLLKSDRFDYHSGRPEQVILIGAVDNNRTRQLFHQIFYSIRELIYIDAGNGMYTGQVVCGVRRSYRTIYKPVGSLHPDVLKSDDKYPSELSCAERALSSPQSITANLTAATAIVSFLYNLLLIGDLNTRYVTFASQIISMRPEVCKSKTRTAA